MTKNISDHRTMKFQNIKTKDMEMAILKKVGAFFMNHPIYWKHIVPCIR